MTEAWPGLDLRFRQSPFDTAMHNLYQTMRVGWVALGVQLCRLMVHLSWFSWVPRGRSAYAHTKGQSKKFSGNPKISLQLHFNPKISANFILRNLYMNIKYPETMQVKVRIASSEPRNISYTMFGVKKYHEDSFSFIWTISLLAVF